MREQVLQWMSTRFDAQVRNQHAKWLMAEPARLEVLWDLFVTEKHPVPQLAAWTLDKVTDWHPELLQPFLPRLVAHLPHMQHDGEKRTSMRLLAASEIPEELLGELFDTAFTWFENPQVAIAIRVHAMQVLYNISQREPDLKRELIVAFQAHLPDGSTGFKSRARRLIKAMTKELRQLDQHPA